MSYNDFSTGKDCRAVIIGPQGRVDFSYVISFEAQQQTTSVRLQSMDGALLGAEIPKGWEGTFQIERGTPELDNFIASLEAAYFNSGSLPTSTLYQYVTETDGSQSTYQFDGVVFKLGSAGLYKGDGAVTQKLDFFAATRVHLT